MRNISNFFILIMLIFPINTFCQNINSYNIDAKLNSEDKTITVSQIMKFKNTSNISLNKIVLEDWANSYVNNRTSLAKRISDEYSRSFTFAKKNKEDQHRLRVLLQIIFNHGGNQKRHPI